MNSSAFSVNSLLNDGKYQFSLLLCNCSFSFQGFSKGTPYTLFTSHHLLNISKVFLTWHINSSNCNGRKALHALNPVMDRNWVAGSDQVWLASLLTFYFSVGVYSVVRQIIVETELSTCLLWRIFIR